MSQPVDDDDRDRPTALDDDAFVSDASLPPEIQPRTAYRHSQRAVLITLGLFLATCVSVFVTGMGAFYAPPFGNPAVPLSERLAEGAVFTGALMLILFCHEMGHYLQSRWYGVPATLPIFIPVPPFLPTLLGVIRISPFGTMGAVIVQAARQANRTAMFDIAICGPLAGIVVAVPIAWWGIQQSRVVPTHPGELIYGDSLLMQAMVWMVHGPLPANHDIAGNSLLFAGWVGIFVTGLNLVPIGQLDGGHITYCLLGRYAHRLAWAMLGLWIVYATLTGSPAYSGMILLLLLFGVRHPPTSDDRAPLGWARVVLGWATMGLFFVCFVPEPMKFISPDPPEAAPEHRQLKEPDRDGKPDLNVRALHQSQDPIAVATPIMKTS